MLKLGRYRATLKDSISILSLTYNMVDIWDRVPGTVSQSWTWKYIRRFTYLLTHYFTIFKVQLLLKGYFVFVQRCSTSKSCFDFQCQLIILLIQLFEQKKRLSFGMQNLAGGRDVEGNTKSHETKANQNCLFRGAIWNSFNATLS